MEVGSKAWELKNSRRHVTEWGCDWCNADSLYTQKRLHTEHELKTGLFYLGCKWPYGPLCDSCLQGADAPPMYKLVRMRLPLAVHAAESVTGLVAEYLYKICAEHAKWREDGSDHPQKNQRVQETLHDEHVQLAENCTLCHADDWTVAQLAETCTMAGAGDTADDIASDQISKVDSDFADYV